MVTPNMLKKYSDKLCVLYAEDNATVLKMTRDFLAKYFDNVDTALNGQEALEKYDPNKHDIVIADINMPIMNGIELSRRILETKPDQTIFITSAHNDSDYLFNLISLGITNYMMKPLNNDKLTTNLYKAAKKIAHEREMREVLDIIHNSDNLGTSVQSINSVIDSLANLSTKKEPHSVELRDAINKLEQVKNHLTQLRSLVDAGR
ncbi:response regulator transcription factor [Desulfurispira natronophila]|uniref:YesN/AraC family two-component response regulator n=1 Tax=Desulfurispira natronophila TaxID=682562 RepID=A0A7W7Y2Y4_9BACT|nr:response regulator [Desulfurispira natronophila]MBB5020979.1 YesN/AraC family two-component response regulator [Desulfurispira natronophila]